MKKKALLYPIVAIAALSMVFAGCEKSEPATMPTLPDPEGMSTANLTISTVNNYVVGTTTNINADSSLKWIAFSSQRNFITTLNRSDGVMKWAAGMVSVGKVNGLGNVVAQMKSDTTLTVFMNATNSTSGVSIWPPKVAVAEGNGYIVQLAVPGVLGGRTNYVAVFVTKLETLPYTADDGTAHTLYNCTINYIRKDSI